MPRIDTPRRRWALILVASLGGAAAPLRAANVTFTIDPTASNQAISKYIYGIDPQSTGYGIANPGLNQPAYSNMNLTLARLGGDRWTGYNWTNNASNPGSDSEYQNDAYLDSSTAPGDAVSATLSDAASRGTATILTIPMAGYVSANENGPVPTNVLPQNSPNFVPSFPTESADPNPSSSHVYQDQFVNWVKTNFASSLTANSANPTMFMLDNEPDLWSSTHPELHPTPTTYAEIVSDSIAYSTMIKNAAPNAMVLGPASYGWGGFLTLQSATDSAADDAAINPATGQQYGNFLSYYLAQMKVASTTAGKRLLDAMDVHWYPEATGINASGVSTRITSDDNSPGVAAARMSAPRSLWDPTYVENSWITQDTLNNQGIQLIPRLDGEIATNYAGTKLSISEYNYGGGTDISGGVAEADVLGIYGKYGVYSAAEWPLLAKEPFILGAMRMFRNYDGNGSSFGDTSVSALDSDTADTSIYASTDSTDPGRMVLIGVNRSMSSMSADIALQHTSVTYLSFTVYQLTSSSAITSDGLSALPTLVGTFPIADLSSYSMPAESVSTIVLTPAPEPTALGGIALAMLLCRRRPGRR